MVAALTACSSSRQYTAEVEAARNSVQSALRSESCVEYDNMEFAARDFGGLFHHRPCAIVRPTTVDAISRVMRVISRIQNPILTVAARGNGHSINGQAQALNGVVIDMRSLKEPITVGREPDGTFYAEVGAGRLWIEVLDTTLRHSPVALAPRTWTDYLYLSVGGTLQNAGVGGQSFKYGPQISNVTRLDVVTGTGELKSCSPTINPELFYASLGGLGQFGIITKARIILEPAPHKVRWIRLLYADFKDFTHDQECMINTTMARSFDYVEGFVVTNNNDPATGWPQVPLPEGASLNNRLIPPNAGPMLYCLELAKYFNSSSDAASPEQLIAPLLRSLRFLEGLRFQVDVTYRDFLDRVHTGEPKLRDLGLWEAPHPWLCLFVPRSHIHAFDAVIFKQSKLRKGVGGPMLVYPMLGSKWDRRSSAVIPDEEIFYLVAILRFSLPYPKGPTAEALFGENEEILRLARAANIPLKQYLPHFSRQGDWQEHFGAKWSKFLYLKSKWDPQAILTPGQGISSPTYRH